MDENMTYLFRDVPKVDISGAIVGKIGNRGAGVYLFTIAETEKTDYLSYLTAMEQAGFEEYMRNDTLNELVFNTAYRKDDRALTVTYIAPQKKIYVSGWMNHLCPQWNAEELFRDIPVMNKSDVRMGEPKDYGAGNYVVTVENTTKLDYELYLLQLDASGFEKFVDNGQGLNGQVFSATYKKYNLVVTVTYVTKLETMYVSACFDLPLSEHLFYKEEYITDNKPDAQTRLHMLELWWFGNSFIIQLKNGHFIVSDGGVDCEVGYLLDYLEEHVPDNEKPVIEAWFISHGHRDHSGVIRAIAEVPAYADRICVEGVYYNEPNDCVIALDPATRTDVFLIRKAIEFMKTTTGDNPKIYRPQTGQRYYFNDITVDIVLGQEQIPGEKYSGDFNDSSTWCMFHIEGQKCLIGGDGDKGDCQFIMDAYDREYMQLDVFTVLHHGLNTRDDFTDYCTFKTILYTSRKEPPERKLKMHRHLKESAKEWLTWEDGTKVLTFPYTIGCAESLPHFEWIYHEGLERP